MPERKKAVMPRLRFPEFRNAGEWKLKRLGKCLEYQQPTLYLVSDANYSDSYNIPVLTAGKTFLLGYTNEKNGVFREPLPVIIFDDFTTATKFVDFPFKVKSSALKILQAKEGINIRFMYDLMQMISYEVGAHERHWISKFQPMFLPIPQSKEQQKIADCLSSLDEVIELEAQKLEALKTHKKGLMQQLFAREGETTPRLRFPEFRNAGKWEVKRLSNTLHRISNGLTIAQVSGSCGVKVTRIETISTGRIDPNKVGYVNTDQDITQYKLRIGDILFSHINSLTHIGKSAYVDKDYNLYHGMNLLRLSVDAESNDSKFVFYLINTSIFQSSVRARANQAINQASINQTELGQSCVLIPTKKEQQKIADCLSSLDEVIELEAQKLDVLKTHKKGLMQQLFPQEVD
ncbi:MAG TPA: restriction endonuclease subunit S [Thermodesulfobacteriota bacterium]|nr:restriction endonuclease subunit S [Thermodesulfobacteriota bacterium]